MKLSDLKPCASCGRGLLDKENNPHTGHWYVFRVSMVMLNPSAVRQTMGVMMTLGGTLEGGPLGLAEVFSPSADKAVVILGEEEPAMYTEAHVCANCAMNKSLCELTESINERRRASETADRHA